jgi:hypothetical protein
MQYSVLMISLYSHAEVIAAGSKVCYLEAISERSLDPLDLGDAWPDNQKIVNVYRDVQVASHKDAEIGVNKFEA